MKRFIKVVIVCLLMLTLVACSASTQTPRLKGFYQSEGIAGEDGLYQFDGNEHDFDILLSDDNSFEIMLPKLDETQLILMNNIDDVPAIFSTEWDDVEEYKDLLK